MTGSCGQFASCVALKLSIDDDVWRIHHDLAVLGSCYHILEVQFLFEIYLCLDLAIFDLVVNNAVSDVFLLDIEHKTAPLTAVFSLKQELAALVQGTGLQTHAILLCAFSQNTDLFILPQNLVLDLRADRKVDLFFL